jgi:hypothetical protein
MPFSPCFALITRMTGPSCVWWSCLLIPWLGALLEEKERGSPAPLQREKLEIQERIYNKHRRLLPSQKFLSSTQDYRFEVSLRSYPINLESPTAITHDPSALPVFSSVWQSLGNR